MLLGHNSLFYDTRRPNILSEFREKYFRENKDGISQEDEQERRMSPIVVLW
jgi:hypothetical protein